MNLKWDSICLGDAAKVISGFAFKSQDFLEIGIPIIKIKNIRLGTVDLSEADFVTPDFIKKLDSKYHIHSNDILISLTGSHLTQPNSVVGRVAKHSPKLGLCLLNQRAGKITITKSDLLDQKFLFYVLYTEEARRNIALMALGAASQANVSPTQVESLEIPLPPLPTQQKIAGILSAYDDLIENNIRRIEILEEMARMLYREWFVKFRFPGHEAVRFFESELGLIPEGWEVTTLGKNIKTQKGYAFKSSWYQQTGVKIVKVSNFTDDSIDINNLISIPEDIAEQYKKYQLFSNDIIIQTVGSWASNPQSVVGKVIKVPEIASKSLLNQNAVKVIPIEPINNTFLYYILKNDEFKSYIINCAQGAASQASITLEAIKEFKVILPPRKIINSFSNLIIPKWKKINNLGLKNINLRKTRDLLLPRLISGEIDVENLAINTGIQP